MSFKFINNIGNEPKKDKVVKTYESKYDSNNIERNMDIGLERLKSNIIYLNSDENFSFNIKYV